MAARSAAKKGCARFYNPVNPSAARKAEKAAQPDTFEPVAREWLSKKAPGAARANVNETTRRLAADVFPWLGTWPIGEIKAPELLAVLRRIEARGSVENARRVLQNFGQIFRYALVTGRVERDIAADLRGALSSVTVTHQAAITDPKEMGGLLRDRRLPRLDGGSMRPQVGTSHVRPSR